MTPAEAAAAEQRYPVEFTGTTGQYFRIWIVNLALTVLTLGLYSAWAKVRKRRYFYAHTRIDGESFEYRGRPSAILKGRLIAVGLLLILVVAGNVYPQVSLETLTGKAIFFVVAVTLGPWLVVRSLKFNAANTAYRNVRFAFLGAWQGCFLVVIKYVWLVFIAILYPYFKHALVRYAARHHAYGTTRFEVADFKKPFIHAYAVAFGLGLLGILALFAAMIALGTMNRGEAPLLMLVGIFAVGAALSQVSWQTITSSFPATPVATTAATNSAGGTTTVSTTTTTTVVSVQFGGGPAAGKSATNSTFARTGVSSPFTNTKLSPLGWGLVLIGGAIGGVSTAANFIALFWFGMWMGMTSRTANTATAKTILFVHVIPWLCITFAAGMGVSIFMMSFTFRSGTAPSARFMMWYPLVSVGISGVLTVAKDIGFFIWARKRLYGSFREQAARAIGLVREPMPTPAPSTLPPPPVIQGHI